MKESFRREYRFPAFKNFFKQPLIELEPVKMRSEWIFPLLTCRPFAKPFISSYLPFPRSKFLLKFLLSAGNLWKREIFELQTGKKWPMCQERLIRKELDSPDILLLLPTSSNRVKVQLGGLILEFISRSRNKNPFIAWIGWLWHSWLVSIEATLGLWASTDY